MGPDEFLFFGSRHHLDNIGWNGDCVDKLWRYNQHYFDDLNSRDAHERFDWHSALIIKWIEQNAVGEGNGWEPYPTSLRIVNWVKWSTRSHSLPVGFSESLSLQARWLEKRLERHLLGNHLFSNAKALIFAGLYFHGREAERWLDTGFDLLSSQLSEQILGDGAHFELSPMYHCLAIEDVLDIVNICRVYSSGLSATHASVLDRYIAKTSLMFTWLAHMSHPDGEISFFNDAAIGIAPNLVVLSSYADRLGLRHAVATHTQLLAASGYARLEKQNVVAILDLAAVGPDYLPGHAHADTLSFELSLFGQRIFVNSGTSEYGISIERQRQRGTSAHNTVLVNGLDSSEVWAGFRVARRAYPKVEHVDFRSDLVCVRASHDGYNRLPGRNSHRREWRLAHDSLTIVDEITGAFRSAVALFHVHPSLQFVNVDDGLVAVFGKHRVSVQFDGALNISVFASSWHPSFGGVLPTQCIGVEFSSKSLVSTIRWSEAS